MLNYLTMETDELESCLKDLQRMLKDSKHEDMKKVYREKIVQIKTIIANRINSEK